MGLSAREHPRKLTAVDATRVDRSPQPAVTACCNPVATRPQVFPQLVPASHGLCADTCNIAAARAAFERGRSIVAPLVEASPDLVLWRQYLEAFTRDLASLDG